MSEAGAAMQYLLELWNEWEIQVVVIVSFSLQVILFFFAGIRHYNISFVVKALLWLVYLLADVVAIYALGHMSSSLSKKSNQLVAFWAPFLVLHLGGQDNITAYALEDNELWLRHLLTMFVQVAGTVYVLYKYIKAGRATFARAAMLVLAAGIFKYGERIRALKRASKKGSKGPPHKTFLQILCGFHLGGSVGDAETRYCFTKNKQFGIYAFIVMTAHALRHAIVKPLVIERNEASIDRDDSSFTLLSCHTQDAIGYVREENKPWAWKKGRFLEVYKAVEMELALMYDMLYTKAEVIHTRYGNCTRAISLVSCFAMATAHPTLLSLLHFLGGACALEVASVVKAIGSTWTYAILKGYGWKWLADAILFVRYHLVIVKDGRWFDSVGQFNLVSFCVHSNKKDLMGAIVRLIGLKDLWNKAHCTKHAKLSPAVKEFVLDLLRGEKRHFVRIEDAATHGGYWARRLVGCEQSEQLDWSMSFEFLKSVLIWHIATSTFLSNPAVKSKLVDTDKVMAKAVNALSDYMMYLLIEHHDILPIKVDAHSLIDETCECYSEYLAEFDDWRGGPYQIVLEFDGSYPDEHTPGEVVLSKAGAVARTMLDMKLGLTHKMVIIGAVWTDILCYAATNASGGFHARQLSNGGEFLTHILLLIQHYCSNPDTSLVLPAMLSNFYGWC
ncbi:hypothetical protein VPH35_132911 [Triticum aestivum]